MLIIFCNEPIKPHQVDSMFAAETEAVKANDGNFHLISYEALTNSGDVERAIAAIPNLEEEAQAVYRGWMLTPTQYTALYDGLLGKNIHLINDPTQYRHAHYLPESYPVIEGHTPKSAWLPYDETVSREQIMQLLQPFGDSSMVVKDYVKSEKHYWSEAFFIPSAADAAAVERVVTRFIELRDDYLNEGLVFREFVEFETVEQTEAGKMPLTLEYRLFFLNGELLTTAQYWDEGDYGNNQPPVEQFLDIAKQVQSNFFSMDIAKRKDGGWMIVELGDGQVSGLPAQLGVDAFYERLLGAIK